MHRCAPPVPPDLLAQIDAAVISVARSADVRARVTAQGAQVITGTPKEMDAFFVTEMKRWGDLARHQNSRAE